MGFADFYYHRYKTSSSFFVDNDDSKLGIVVIIPCFNDSFVFETLNSLNQANSPNVKIEIIVVVNSSSDTSEDIVSLNRSVYEELQYRAETNFYEKFCLLPILIEGINPKIAGVGYARKIAMDEAVRRFNSINNPNGLIFSLDADAIVDKDYFTAVENAFFADENLAACTLQFEHNYKEEGMSDEIINACKLYEIYLRYFRLALKYANFPYPIHTIGSCFVVKAWLYVKAGGMSQRKGGEDFYFLHKLAPITQILQINKRLVFPSPRISNRVPFGTGPSVKKIIENADYKVYNFKLFKILKQFYSNIGKIENYPPEIVNFCGNDSLKNNILDCKQNTGSKQSFIKRMHRTFDAFFVIKFLNSFDYDSDFPKENVLSMVSNLFEASDIQTISDIDDCYYKILELDLHN